MPDIRNDSHPTPHAVEAETVCARFGDVHHHISQLLTRITGDLRAGDSSSARDGWRRLDRELSEHMAFEEREILPEFALVDATAARELRADHVEFRRMLDDLGTAIDLKRLSCECAEDFFDRLERHAAREEDLLYRWADASPARRLQLLDALRR